MKKIIGLFVLLTVSIFITQSLKAQEGSQDNLEGAFEVQLNKSSYFLLEPIVAKFKCTVPSNVSTSRILQNSSIRVYSNTSTKEFHGLSMNITQGEPQRLPDTGFGQQLMNMKVGPVDQSSTERDTSTERNVTAGVRYFEKEEIIDRVNDFFPTPGNYQIQFLLCGTSKLIDITIEEPKGINKEAYNFLTKYEGNISFNWVWTEKNGEALLKAFVNKYNQTIYGESAISYLGHVYQTQNRLEEAQAEFQKIKFSKNKVIADDAKKSLVAIEERQAYLRKQ